MADRLFFILDRFEGEIAVLETSAAVCFNVPRRFLPSACREGDVIRVEGQGGSEAARWTLTRDVDASLARHEENRARRARLSGADPGGDLEL